MTIDPIYLKQLTFPCDPDAPDKNWIADVEHHVALLNGYLAKAVTWRDLVFELEPGNTTDEQLRITKVYKQYRRHDHNPAG